MNKQIVWQTGDFADFAITSLIFLLIYVGLRLFLAYVRNKKFITQEIYVLGLWVSIVVAGLIAALPTTYFAR